MPIKTLNNERNKAIRDDFKELTKVKHIRSAHAYELLSKKYFLKETTIAFIVHHVGRYSDKPKKGAIDPKQMSIFDIINLKPTKKDEDNN